jgi:hypothetical protein
LVVYSAARTTETLTNTFAPGGPYGGYSWGWKVAAAFDSSGAQTVLVGELVVDIADVKNKTFIWRGAAKDTLSEKSEKNLKVIDKAGQRCSRTSLQRLGRSNATDFRI